MILAPFFTTHKDWQRRIQIDGSAAKIRGLLDSTTSHGLCVTLVYDKLPEDLISTLASDTVRFERVRLEDFDEHLSPNDSRFLVYEKLLSGHTDWDKVFLVDAFDVRAAQDPFPTMKPGALYVGSDATRLASDPWMGKRFTEMGGKYLKWYNSVEPMHVTLNAGVVGGCRGIMLEFLQQLRAVLTDHSLKAFSARGDVHVNMAALNYVVYTGFAGKFQTGQPVNSNYKKYELDRHDVWFIHK